MLELLCTVMPGVKIPHKCVWGTASRARRILQYFHGTSRKPFIECATYNRTQLRTWVTEPYTSPAGDCGSAELASDSANSAAMNAAAAAPGSPEAAAAASSAAAAKSSSSASPLNALEFGRTFFRVLYCYYYC